MHLSFAVRAPQLLQRSPRHRAVPTHHLVEDAAQGIHVRGNRHRFPSPLLGGHIKRCAHDAARQLRATEWFGGWSFGLLGGKVIRCLSGWVAVHNQSVICDSEDTRLDENIARRIGLRNAAAAPLALEDEVIGTLVVVNKRKSAAQFDESDLDLLQTLAYQATVAINKMRLYEQMQRRSEQLRVINAILSDSLSSLDTDALLRQGALKISQTFGYILGGISHPAGQAFL